MKQAIYIVYFFILLLPACKKSKEIYTYRNNSEKLESVKFYPDKKDTNYYKVTYYHWNEAVQCEGFKLNGLKHGRWFYYNEDGDTMAVYDFEYGLLSDSMIIYYEDGHLEKIIVFDEPAPCLCDSNCPKSYTQKLFYGNGKLEEISTLKDCLYEGVSYVYDSASGKLRNIIHYKNDTLHGLWRKIFFDGVQIVGLYEHGKKEGEWRKYDKDSNLIEQWFCQNDLYQGELSAFYPNGKCRYIEYYKDDELIEIKEAYDINAKKTLDKGNGKLMSYYANGNVKFELSYRNSKQDGASIFYYSNGKIEQEANYKNNKLDGKLINYFRNGAINSQYEYCADTVFLIERAYDAEGVQTLDNGKGVLVSYFPTGEIQYIGHYENSKKHGECTWFYKNGIVEDRIIYKNGKPFTHLESYDKEGVKRNGGTLENGNGSWILYYDNNAIKEERNYVNSNRTDS
jgi:antitoxin component YwqK of YwqJK toxin-antitoxin module